MEAKTVAVPEFSAPWPPAAAVGHLRTGSLVAVEAKQRQLETQLDQGRLAVRMVSDRLDSQLAAAEHRIVQELANIALEERASTREAVEGVLKMLAREEARRIDATSEKRALEVEREWREALIEAIKTADSEIRGCSAGFSAQAEALDSRFGISLAALQQNDAHLRHELEAMPAASRSHESALTTQFTELSESVEIHVAEHDTQLRALSESVKDATANLAAQQIQSAKSAALLLSNHTYAVEETIVAAETVRSTCYTELRASDDTLDEAHQALAAASFALGDESGGAAKAFDANELIIDIKDRVKASRAVEALGDQVKILSYRCAEVERNVAQDSACAQERARVDGGRAARVEALLADLEPQVVSLGDELAASKGSCATLAAKLESEKEARRLELLDHDAKMKAKEAERAAEVLDHTAKLKAKEAELAAEVLDHAAKLEAKEAEHKATLMAMAAEHKAKMEAKETEHKKTIEAKETVHAAELQAKATEHEQAEARASRLQVELSASLQQMVDIKESSAALSSALDAERENSLRSARAAEAEKRVLQDERAAEKKALQDELAEVRQTLADLVRGREQALQQVEVLRTESVKQQAKAATEMEEAERRLFDAAEQRTELEADLEEAVSKTYLAAHRHRVPQHYHPGNNGGAVDEIDFAVANALHAAALPRKISLERISRGWYWMDAPVEGVEPVYEGRRFSGGGYWRNQQHQKPTKVRFCISKGGVLMAREGTQTLHPVSAFLNYLGNLISAPDAGGSGMTLIDRAFTPFTSTDAEADDTIAPPRAELTATSSSSNSGTASLSPVRSLTPQNVIRIKSTQKTRGANAKRASAAPTPRVVNLSMEELLPSPTSAVPVVSVDMSAGHE